MDDGAAYLALQTHDARFDGRLFVGVTSTGIYCRPVCRVRLPRRENCRFFPEAAQAEAAGFRPCLRCRPELAPGLALVDSSRSLARSAALLLERHLESSEEIALPAVAERLGVTERHLRRIFQAEHGVSPIQWITTRRLLLAKRLLTDTPCPSPRWRKPPVSAACVASTPCSRNAIGSRPPRCAGSCPDRMPMASRVCGCCWAGAPYDAEAMLDFLGGRPLPGWRPCIRALGGAPCRCPVDTAPAKAGWACASTPAAKGSNSRCLPAWCRCCRG